MVQKQIVVKNKTKQKNYFLVCNVYIHACIVSQCYYELIYYSFVLFVIVDSHWFPPPPHPPWSYNYMYLRVCNCFRDRLPDRHSCLNLYPWVIKVQSVNLSLSLSLSLSLRLDPSPPLSVFAFLSVPVCLYMSSLSLSVSSSFRPSLFSPLSLSLSPLSLSPCVSLSSVSFSLFGPVCLPPSFPALILSDAGWSRQTCGSSQYHRLPRFHETAELGWVVAYTGIPCFTDCLDHWFLVIESG